MSEVLQPMSAAPAQAPLRAAFLPDLCGMTALFVVVVVSELVALLIVVSQYGFGPDFGSELALLTLYTQWLGLSSAGVLCFARGPLNGLNERLIASLSFGLILAVTYAIAEIAWWVVNPVVGAGALIEISRGELILRTVAISAIVGVLVLRYFYVQFHWKQRMASEAEARLEALQARIRPHFFFNCMNTIASLTRSEPKLAERAVEDLADLFRASFTNAQSPVPVSEEIAFVERYLSIEKLRLGERLQVEWDIETLPDGARLPLLSLQPIVENAIYHGVESAPDGGLIEIAVGVNSGRLRIRVVNALGAAATERQSGNRIALENVRLRLGAHFGDEAQLLTQHLGDRFSVIVEVPLSKEAAS